MIKRNKAKAIISSLLILVPAIIGLCLWNDLPEIFMAHWGADGKADRFWRQIFCRGGYPFHNACCTLDLPVYNIAGSEEQGTKLSRHLEWYFGFCLL